MKYRDYVVKHLSSYKKVNIPKAFAKPGIWWVDKKKNICKYHDHILPYVEGQKEKAIEQNILPLYRKAFLQSPLYKGIDFHQFAHFLNSSQVMCINFFFPLWQEQRLDDMLKVLAIKLHNGEVIDYSSVRFELNSELDFDKVSKRSTTFDFYIPLIKKDPKKGAIKSRELFFEIKYTEEGFGGTTKDIRHQELFKNVYSQHVNRVFKTNVRDLNTFLANYQLCRNLIHLDDKGERLLVVVSPERNEIINKQLRMARNDLLQNAYMPSLIDITWETMHENTTKLVADSPMLKAQMSDFYTKYLDINYE